MTAAQFLARYTVEALATDGARPLNLIIGVRGMAEAVAAGRGFAAVTDTADALVIVRAQASDCEAWIRDAIREPFRAGFTVHDFAPVVPRYSLAAGNVIFDGPTPAARLARMGDDSNGHTRSPLAHDALARQIVAALNANA